MDAKLILVALGLWWLWQRQPPAKPVAESVLAEAGHDLVAEAELAVLADGSEPSLTIDETPAGEATTTEAIPRDFFIIDRTELAIRKAEWAAAAGQCGQGEMLQWSKEKGYHCVSKAIMSLPHNGTA